MTAFFQPYAVVDQFGHDARIMDGPTGNRQPLVGFNHVLNRRFTALLHGPKPCCKSNEMFCLLCFQLRLESGVNPVNRLTVYFCRPSIGEDFIRATQTRRFQKDCEFVPSLLHGLLDDMSSCFL